MNPLDNELVKKYFGKFHPMIGMCEEKTALAVLESMQQPIKKGERYLNLQGPNGNNEAFEAVNDGEWFGFSEVWHPSYLRLPDSFQPPQPCEHERIECLNCAKPFCALDKHGTRCECKPPVQANAPERCAGWPVSFECGNQNHYHCDDLNCKCSKHQPRKKA